MFKKKPTIKPLAPLRSSDRRKTADAIIADYALELPQTQDASTEEKAAATASHTSLRNGLLPDNIQTARFITTHGPELKQASGTLYVGSLDGEGARVLWFEIEGKTYPSVYTLWKHPQLVPLLHTHEPVVKKLQGGADLMIPGLAGGPPFPEKAKKGAIVAVASTDRPSVPVAIGVCVTDVSQLQQVQGAKGHAVQTVHWLGDEVWGYSTNGRPGANPPDELEGWLQDNVAQKIDNVELDDDDEENDGGVPLNADTESAGNTSHYNGHVEGEDPPTDELHNPHQAAKEMSTKEIDDAFRNAFLYGVHHHKAANPTQPSFGLNFPLSQSSVMSILIQPFLPTFTPEQEKQMQIKKTSWKNIKKFIKSLDKAKILKSKEKDGHETVIMDIDFEDPTIISFKPYRLPKKETMAGSSQGRGEAATAQMDTADDSVGQKLKVESYFKPSSKLVSIFESADTGTRGLFTAAEIRPIVTAYIENENLVSETNKRLVKLNPTLANAVFDGSGSLDKEVLAKGSVPRDALIDRIIHACQSSYAIIRNGDPASSAKPKSGTPPKVHITLETRSGNKTVTKVSGLEAYYVNPKPLADELRKVCAGSTSVEPLAGGAKKNEKEVMEIMIQGPQKDAVVKSLERRGVDRRWVEYLDKTKGKKR